MEPQPKTASAEKTEFVYHGSITGDIEEFEPRKRYVPGGADVPPRVYATINPAFAAAHSFPWSSDEGIDLRIEGDKVTLCIPAQYKDRLNQPVFIYKIKGDLFSKTTEEATGETLHAEESVRPEEVQEFASVTEALEHFGGAVEILK